MSPKTAEAQRKALHKQLDNIANDVRGQVDGWDLKGYVLGILFYRYISEKVSHYVEDLESDADFSFAEMNDTEAEAARPSVVEELGYYIPPSELFENVLDATKPKSDQNPNLNVDLANIFRRIEDSTKGEPSEGDFAGLFSDIDTSSPKLGRTPEDQNASLRGLMGRISDLDLGDFSDSEIDQFGDVYEYLMNMFATQAGRSGGEYFTPQAVSEVVARLTMIGRDTVERVYDPACGSGSLLLKFAKLADNKEIDYFGQESNLTTYNLARMNMILHGVGYEHFDFYNDDTLKHPHHWDQQPFDAIVSNPPYSTSWDGDSDPVLINDERFTPAGVLAPKSDSDLAFVMHILSWLKDSGTAAVVSFPGVLYRGRAEQKIRKYLIDSGFVEAVIQMPPNLFYGVNISVCILVLKKSKTTNDVVFVDASGEFVKDGSKNYLTPANRDRIVGAVEKREDEEHFVRIVDAAEIAENDYTLSVSTYVEKEDTREIIDIDAVNAELAELEIERVDLVAKINAFITDEEVGANEA
ncbi:type I restriction-modification system subunit M [Corynebacterium sp. S7]